ncbi:helix-turn-helix domain-containing protein [Vibrio sp. CAIM 722]|uniref:Helix-turn-helix domain-containing protein n=1 Tax=Vibrio eleionomae TaxID=2653505 RepID=A0A7X4LK18_9VIBR|nr:AraC family transcriptional regulator [Vibrio eleionomae]MZI92986.1 helix-turn-helix domain-containing protein [Vibrio eleionomae]
MVELAELMTQYADKFQLNQLEGSIDTAIPGVRFYRSGLTAAKAPFMYDSGIIILGQGHKKITVGNEKQVTYGPNDYLVAGVPMPLECESFGSQQEPILGLTIRIDHAMIVKQVRLMNELGATVKRKHQDRCGVNSVAMNEKMLHSCKRLMLALLDPIEAKVLGDVLLEEILFRVLTSEEGHLFEQLASFDGQYARVAKALAKVHADFCQPLTVQELAQEANMSVSAFHQAFRHVTMESPLQYLKKVRLNKAKQMIQTEGVRVNDAARLVGYSSPSQFSREFKRHFNQTPRASKSLNEVVEV